MALFKISKGSKVNLPTTLTEGFCWYTYDDSKFYIDHKDEKGVLVRKALNAQDAETLTGASLSTILNSSELEIPTSKAVLDALDVAKTEIGEQIEGLNTAIENRMPVPDGYDSADYCAVGYVYGEPSALPLNPDGADGYSVPMRDWNGDIMLPYDQDALFTWDEGYGQYGKGDYGDHYAISAATARKYFYTKEDLAYLVESFAHEDTGVTVTLSNDSTGYIGFLLSEPLEEDLTVYISYSYPLLEGDCFESWRDIVIPANTTSYEINLFGDDSSRIDPDGGGYSIFNSSYYWTDDPDSSPIKLLDDEHLFITNGSNVELNIHSFSAAEVYATNMYVDGVEVATKNDLVGVGGDYVPIPSNLEVGAGGVVSYNDEGETEISYLNFDSADPHAIPVRDENGNILLPTETVVDEYSYWAVSGDAVYNYVNAVREEIESAVVPQNIGELTDNTPYALVYQEMEPRIMPLINDYAEPNHIPIRTDSGDIELPKQYASDVIQEGNSLAVCGEAVYEYVNDVVGNIEEAIAQISAELHTYAQNLTSGES